MSFGWQEKKGVLGVLELNFGPTKEKLVSFFCFFRGRGADGPKQKGFFILFIFTGRYVKERTPSLLTRVIHSHFWSFETHRMAAVSFSVTGLSKQGLCPQYSRDLGRNHLKNRSVQDALLCNSFSGNSLLLPSTIQQRKSQKNQIQVKAEGKNVLIVNTNSGGHAVIGFWLAKQLRAWPRGHSVTILTVGEESDSKMKKPPFTQFEVKTSPIFLSLPLVSYTLNATCAHRTSDLKG